MVHLHLIDLSRNDITSLFAPDIDPNEYVTRGPLASQKVSHAIGNTRLPSLVALRPSLDPRIARYPSAAGMQVTPPPTPGNTSQLSRGTSLDQSPTATSSYMPALAAVSPGWGSAAGGAGSVTRAPPAAAAAADRVLPTPFNTAPPQYDGHPHLIATGMPDANLEELQRARAQRMKQRVEDVSGEAAAALVRGRLAATQLSDNTATLRQSNREGSDEWQDVVRCSPKKKCFLFRMVCTLFKFLAFLPRPSITMPKHLPHSHVFAASSTTFCPNQNRAVFYDDLSGPGLDTDSQDSDDTVGSSGDEGEPEAGRGEAALDSSLLGVTAGGAGGEEATAARLRRRAPCLSDDQGLLGEDEEGEAKVHGHLELDTTAGAHRSRDTASGTGPSQRRSQDAARDATQAPAAASRSPASSETGSMASGRAGHGLTQRTLRTFTLMSDSSFATPVRQPVRLHVVCPELRVLGLADNLLTNISGLERLTKLETLDLRSNRIADVGSLGALVNLPGLRVLMLEVSRSGAVDHFLLCLIFTFLPLSSEDPEGD